MKDGKQKNIEQLSSLLRNVTIQHYKPNNQYPFRYSKLRDRVPTLGERYKILYIKAETNEH